MELCRICGSQNLSWYSFKECMFGIKETFNYFQCNGCRCLQIGKIPDDMARFYPDEYHSYTEVKKSKLQRKGKKLKTLLKQSSPSTMEYGGIFATLKISLNDRILDVGAGSGELIYLLRECGYANAFGIDPYLSREKKYDNGLTIEKKSLEEVDTEFDLIMLNHVFEHLPDQRETLELLKSKLTQKGQVLIRIPVIGKPWDLYKGDWFQIDPPRHFFLHSKESFKLLCDQAGFEIVDTIYDSNPAQFEISDRIKSGLTINSRVKYSNPLSRIVGKIEKLRRHSRYKKLSMELNEKKEGDQAGFILRPKRN